MGHFNFGYLILIALGELFYLVCLLNAISEKKGGKIFFFAVMISVFIFFMSMPIGSIRKDLSQNGVYVVKRCNLPSSPSDTLSLKIGPIQVEPGENQPASYIRLDQDEITETIRKVCKIKVSYGTDTGVCLRLERKIWGAEQLHFLKECPPKTYKPYKYEL